MATGRKLNAYLIDKALVGHRYTLDELKERLNILSSETVNIGSSDESELIDGEDFRLDFNSETGYGTIWYLKTRTDKLYITETQFESDTFVTEETEDTTNLDKDKAEKLFVEIASQYEEYNDIIDKIRSLHSSNVITDEEYDYITDEWDNMLIKYNL